ncbi:MAG: hypothetical protein ACRCSF_13445 [Mycobacteriaceae bacterium]
MSKKDAENKWHTLPPSVDLNVVTTSEDVSVKDDINLQADFDYFRDVGIRKGFLL